MAATKADEKIRESYPAADDGSIDDGDGSFTLDASNPYPQVYRDDPRKPKKKPCCTSNCINGSLLPLKILLFVFYGGKLTSLFVAN